MERIKSSVLLQLSIALTFIILSSVAIRFVEPPKWFDEHANAIVYGSVIFSVIMVTIANHRRR